ncbi:MAG: lipoprotein-releasing ABC transporter permease subunit [Chlamydiota bacterium]|nr:lipoprotein-releasing ABC transporter permease subunit [Chlamydiota bacterium]
MSVITRLPLAAFISLRYLKGKHRHKLISIITVFSVLGIAIGVMALIVVISVMEGFDHDLKNRILGVYAPITIGGDTLVDHYPEMVKQLESIEDITGVAPFVTGQIMVRMGDRVVGVLLRGIDPALEAQTSQVENYIIKGDMAFKNASRGRGIIIGKEFSHHFNLDLGDSIDLLSPVSVPTPLGLSSRTTRFHVIGIFESGMYEYDFNLIFCSLPSAQGLYGLGENVHGLTVNIRDIEQASAVKDKIRTVLQEKIRVKTWLEMNRNLFQALVMEKWLIFWILLLIVLVAAFNITSSLIMMVMEKTKEIGILKAIGATRTMLMKIFLFQGLLIGFVGTFLGFICGLLIANHLNAITGFITKWTGFDFFPRDIYYLDKIPVDVNVMLCFTIAICALGISLVAAVYPAMRASRLDPVEAIRYE